MQVSARIHTESGTPELFFYAGGDLTSYSRIGEHSPCEYEYMVQCTHVPKNQAETDEAVRLFNFWRGLPGGDSAKLVKRLTYPR